MAKGNGGIRQFLTNEDFRRGLRAEYPSLDEALSSPRMESKYRLLDLESGEVSYDPSTRSFTTAPDAFGNTQTIPLLPQFSQYMREYGDKVRFITHNGTPWLAESDHPSKEQRQSYLYALKTGAKQDVAILNWVKTDASSKETGHTALSVGRLALGSAAPNASSASGTTPIEGYQADLSGSYYPSQTVWVDRPSRRDHMNDAIQDRKPTAEDTHAHAVGLLTRNSVIPSAAAATGAVIGGLAVGRATKGIRNAAARATIRLAGTGAIAYAAGRLTGIGKSSTGSVRIKEEQRGHGVLATLITPGQRDLLEHTMAGLHCTYFEKYNLLTHNCADFADEMMERIGLDTPRIVRRAMETEPPLTNLARKVAKNITIPSHIRPDRHQWATRRLDPGERGIVTVDDQDISIRKLSVSGQSAVLIETDNQDFFKGKPLDVLSKVLESALELDPNSKRDGEFAFGPNVQKVEKSGGLSR